ncbi:hypothetical protein ACYCFC_10190 [Stutzerimonas sp. NM35]
MKPYLRLCLILLISFSLPVNGMAAVGLVIEACQMQDGEVMISAPTDHAAHDTGVGNGAEHSHGQNPLCKSDHQCKTSCMLQVAVTKSVLTTTAHLLITYIPEHIPSGSGNDLWRPPRF